MSDHSDFSNLPDRAVVTKAQFCKVTSLSEATIDRLHKRGEGPPRVKLSVRRIGYTMGEIRKWLSARAERAQP
jgi:predicted DNA-binding transcriptional regulator AlpA